MPIRQDNMADNDGISSVEPPDDKDGDDEKFVEVDPSGRYGRYEEVLGKGAFKTVYRAFDEVEGIEVAWNQVKVQDVLQSPEDLERLYSEVHLLKTLKHKNIIKFYSSWVDTKTKNVNFITEIFTSGTLRQYRKKHKHVDIKAVKNWSRQILRGLLYLHSHDPPIIHRDLKCDNIFVNGNQGEVKIGDLGLAAILRQAHAAHSVIGTPEFMAPELYEEEYNELVDIYSFGMCLLEMVTFEYPYSECINAAQIYKKVSSILHPIKIFLYLYHANADISMKKLTKVLGVFVNYAYLQGKKPAALDKVRDQEVRAFVEKCLATASSRLPARELLMDPFLQCEGDREAIECLPTITLSKTRADDFEELGVICEEHSPMLTAGERFYNIKAESDRKGRGSGEEDRSHVAGSSRRMPPLSSGRRSDDDDDPSSCTRYSKDRARRSSRDFRVKGKRKDDDTIFLRLRIADHDGHSRNIHFPFDIEGDTAMCVASEMVAELDLSDQDVTTIAEMIDAEILALVPEWQPGVAVDDETGYTTIPDGTDPVAFSSDESVLEELSTSWKPRSTSPRISSVAVGSPPRMVEGTMHGRFEEVTYPPRGSHSRPGSDPVIFTSESSDERDEGDDSEEHRSKFGGTPDTGSPGLSPKHTDCTEGHSRRNSFNELVEIRRSAGTSRYVQEPWEVLHDENDRLESSVQDDVALSEGDDDEDAIAQELQFLAWRQEQELQELHRRHEQAMLQVKNRRRQKNSYGEHGQPISPDSQQTDSSCEVFPRTETMSSLRAENRPFSRNSSHGKLSVDNWNSKQVVDEGEDSSGPALQEGKCSNLDVRYVAAPKPYGLGHNLQGHVVQESSSGKRPARESSPFKSDGKGSSHHNRPYDYMNPRLSIGGDRAGRRNY